jgi:hypothetical protein
LLLCLNSTYKPKHVIFVFLNSKQAYFLIEVNMFILPLNFVYQSKPSHGLIKFLFPPST